jgi:hypothetical protein
MKAAVWLHHVLEVDQPWHVLDSSYDAPGRRLDVWVGPQAAPERKGWFSRGPAKPATGTGPEQIWRHLNMGGTRCFIHLRETSGASVADLPWAGDEGVPFTHAMSRQIATLLSEGIKLPAICVLLDVQISELWKFKLGLDNGKMVLSVAPAPADGRALEAGQTGAAASSMPDLADPIWEKLLEGGVDLNIRVLSLKLLLTKLQDQMRVINDPEVRMLKKHEVYRYFVRHEKVLGHELAQLRKF